MSTTSSFIVGNSGTGALTISGTGVVNVESGTGTLYLASGAGSAGTLNLAIGNGDTAGTLQAGAVAGGAGTALVNFNESGAYTFTQSISGSNLSLNQTGSGTTTLSGSSYTYSGSTTITQGQLTIAAGSAISGTGNIIAGNQNGDNGLLEIDGGECQPDERFTSGTMPGPMGVSQSPGGH